MADRLDEIRARLAAATPAPWRTWNDGHVGAPDTHIGGIFMPTNGSDPARRMPDAIFAAAAPADVGWLLEHIEQQRVEVERLQEALNRRHAPPSSEWLTKLHDRAHQQMQSRVWRTVDTLVHQLDAEQLRAAELRAQRQAVHDLCDANDHGAGSQHVPSNSGPVSWPDAVRAALGAADER